MIMLAWLLVCAAAIIFLGWIFLARLTVDTATAMQRLEGQDWVPWLKTIQFDFHRHFSRDPHYLRSLGAGFIEDMARGNAEALEEGLSPRLPAFAFSLWYALMAMKIRWLPGANDIPVMIGWQMLAMGRR